MRRKRSRQTAKSMLYSDQDEPFKWFKIIHFTIAYKGIAQDESIKIPLLGYAEKSLTITYQNGFKNESVTFSVRVGPNRLSVKASVPVDCNNYDTMFAFQNYSVDE